MNWDLQQDHDLISAGDDRVLQTFHNDTDNDLTHAPVASPTTKGGEFPTADTEEEEGVMRFGIIVLVAAVVVVAAMAATPRRAHTMATTTTRAKRRRCEDTLLQNSGSRPRETTAAACTRARGSRPEV